MDNSRVCGLKYKLVVNKQTDIQARSLEELDGLIVIDVYEGYKKLGRFRLKDIKVKFS